VLSSTDGVSHDTEVEIKPSSSASNQQQHKPLYEQLRENAEKEKEKLDEMERAMKGVTTLNEDDVAFIQSVESRKVEIESNARKKEEEEIQLFRAARMEKSFGLSEEVENDVKDFINQDSRKHTTDVHVSNILFSPKSSSLKTIQPKIRRKRRRSCDKTDVPVKNSVAKEVVGDDDKEKSLSSKDGNFVTKSTEHDHSSATESGTVDMDTRGNPLSSLLAYSSDSDENSS
jgi:N-terminal domain of NEFA-interacting nuclear protein NIP30.